MISLACLRFGFSLRSAPVTLSQMMVMSPSGFARPARQALARIAYVIPVLMLILMELVMLWRGPLDPQSPRIS